MQNFCKRQNGGNGLCRTSASAKKEKMAFAELLQTSKWRKRPLQNFCKRRKGENGLCRTSANVKMEETAFAELLQAPKRRKWLLQNFCKRQNGGNGLCRTSASAKKEKMAFAGLLQAFPKAFWPSRSLRRGSLLTVCLHRTHIKSKKCAELALFCFFCVDRKQMV